MRLVPGVATGVTLGVVAMVAHAQPADAPLEAPPAAQPLPPAPPPPPSAAPLAPAPTGWTPAYPPPGKPPPGLRPPPTVSPYQRRPVELIPELSLAFPHCASGDVSDDRCAGVRGGAGFGFIALWRVTPHLAWGGGFDVAGFRYDPPARTGLHEGGAAAAQLRLLGRVYFVAEGSFDPYVELGIGGVALGTSARDANDDRFEETGAGPALSLGGGLDFFLSRRLRLGPYLTVTQVFVDKIRRCRGGDSGSCEDLPRDDHGYLSRYGNLGVRLTIMIGNEL
jgi:hypothetical protein